MSVSVTSNLINAASDLLTRLPDGLLHLRNLTQLGLNDVALQRLPNDISK